MFENIKIVRLDLPCNNLSYIEESLGDRVRKMYKLISLHDNPLIRMARHLNPLSNNIFKIYNKHDLYTQLLQNLRIITINKIIFENMQFLKFVLINN